MIEVAVMHSFVLVDALGVRTLLLSVEMDDKRIEDVAVQVASAVVSRLSDPDAHVAMRIAAEHVFEKVEAMPGTMAMAGERISGDRLLRVVRHIDGDGAAVVD